jgi:4-hydroxy-3-polyprenylbenzoate decarboxylase
LINACREHRYLESFSKRTTLSRTIWERIAARWNRDFRLPGTAPELLAYDTEEPSVAYHENAELFRGRQAPTEPPPPR